MLRPFVHTIWAGDSGLAPPNHDGAICERVLPTGLMHLVFRWSDRPLVVRCDDPNKKSIRLGPSLVGGTRSTSYLRQLSGASHSVGALLFPGTASLLFRVPANELAERHTELDALWSPTDVANVRERLETAGSNDAKLRVFEALLLARLPRVRAMHPAVAEALHRLAQETSITEVVERSGYSHRAFITLFEEAVGLTPKVFARVTRLQRALELMNHKTRPSLVQVALSTGYADQAHFTREFGRIAGISPTYYRQVSKERSNHVPVHERT